MVIIEQLAAELEIELPAELRNTLTDMLRLHLKVLIIIETLFKHRTTPSNSLFLRCHRAPIHCYYVNKLKQSKRLNQYKKVISSCQFILVTERPGGATTEIIRRAREESKIHPLEVLGVSLLGTLCQR